MTSTPQGDDRSIRHLLDQVLRGHFTRREVLATGRIEAPVRRLVGLCLLLGGSYGLCLGTFAAFGGSATAWLQMLASAVKVPLLFVLTLLVSFPSLYVFAALQRLPLDFRNTLRLMLITIVVQLTVIASLGPVFAFFAASTTSYPFLLLLNVVIFAIGGLLGLMLLRRATRDMFQPAVPRQPAAPAANASEGSAEGQPPGPTTTPPGAQPPRALLQAADQARRLLAVWCLVYGVVGAQMGWLLRPFLGSPDVAFTWFRPREDNFLIALLRTLGHLFGR